MDSAGRADWVIRWWRDMLALWPFLAAACLVGFAVQLAWPVHFPSPSEGGWTLVTLEDVVTASADQKVVILDARTPLFFEAGHIPGARNLPGKDVFKLPASALMEIPLTQRIVVYCAGQDCTDSRKLARFLAARGYENVSIYEGGWEEWTEAGQPEEK